MCVQSACHYHKKNPVTRRVYIVPLATRLIDMYMKYLFNIEITLLCATKEATVI